MTNASFRARYFIYVFCAMLALPPGFGTSRLFAASRTSTFTRDSVVETYRNPQFSSGQWNRFLYAYKSNDLVSDGSSEWSTPSATGYGNARSPEALWLTHYGEMQWAETDLNVKGVGLHLAFERIWRGSVTSYDGPLGKGWEFNWNKRLFEEMDNDVVLYDMGRTETYDEASGVYTSPAGRYDALAKDTGPNPDVFTRTDKYGVIETYEDEGSGWYRLIEIKDTNDNALSFTYNGSDQLTTVTDTLGRDTTLTYDGNGRIETITDVASRDWDYGYDGSGYLTSVTDPEGAVWEYAYDGNGRLDEIEQPTDGGTAYLTLTYDGTNTQRVNSQTLNGETFNLTYGSNEITVTDRAGSPNDIKYEYNGDRMITRRRVWRASTSSWVDTDYSYNADGEVTLVTFPKGNQVAYTYDSLGNITEIEFREDSSDTTDPVTWTYTYTGLSRIDTITDPLGNVWDYGYDADGNLTSRAAPAVTVPSGIASTDKNSNSINDGTISESFVYNSAGLLTKHTDTLGTEHSYTYHNVNSNPAYLATITRDSAMSGLAIDEAYTVDTVGNVLTYTSPESDVTTYTYDDRDRVLTITEPGSIVTTNTYDDSGRLTQISRTNDTDVGNSAFVVNHTYDKVGNRLTTVEDVDATANRLTTTYTYDENDRLETVTTPEGRETQYTYDTQNQQIIMKRMVTGGSDPTTTVTFDDNGNVTTREDPLGNDTTYTYDDLDRLTKVTDPEGHYTTYTYDEVGRRISTKRYDVGDTLLAEDKTSYDQAGRVYKTERWAKKADLSTNLGSGGGWQVTNAWLDETGATLERSGDICGCSVSTSSYDALGRRVSFKDALSGAEQNEITYEYDEDGQLTKEVHKDKSQNTGVHASQDVTMEYTYDSRGRRSLAKRRMDVSTTYDTTYTYGDRDQVETITDPEGRVTRYEYNEQLWKTKEIQETAGDDVITEYTYDKDGLVTMRRAKNATEGDQDTLYTYDELGRLTETEWADAETTTETYDLAGNNLTTTQPIGTVVTRTFDDNNRVTDIDLTLATGVIGITAIDYEYDGLGRLTEASTSEGGSYTTSVERTYNTLGKIETETQVINGWNSGAGRTITYTWNEKGQKTAVDYPVSGDDITYTRDDLDRIDTIERNSTEVVDYTYLGKRVIRKEFPGSEDLRTYDALGRLTEIHHKDLSSGNTLAKFVYTLDDSGMITGWDRFYYNDNTNTRITAYPESEGSQYEYDGAGRLTTALRGVETADMGTAMATNITNNDYRVKAEYTYDQTGNRLELDVTGSGDQDAEFNDMNELIDLNTVTRVYDDNGNYEGPSSTYMYDFMNRLAGMDDGGAETFEWHYDAFGRCVERERTDTTTVSPRSYYDGNHMVERTRHIPGTPDVEVLHKQYVFGNEIDEVIALESSPIGDPDEMSFFHADHLFSTQVVVDDVGAIQESFRYEEFGQSRVLDDSFTALALWAPSPLGNIFRFTGRPFASQASPSGSEQWFEYRSRHYQADLGAFAQRDLLGYIDGSNMYSYVQNAPTTSRDPYGTCTHSCVQPTAPRAPADGPSVGGGGEEPYTDPYLELPDEGPRIRCGEGCSAATCQAMIKKVKAELSGEPFNEFDGKAGSPGGQPGCWKIECGPMSDTNDCSGPNGFTNNPFLPGACPIIRVDPEKFDNGVPSSCDVGAGIGCQPIDNEVAWGMFELLMFHNDIPPEDATYTLYEARTQSNLPCASTGSGD